MITWWWGAIIPILQRRKQTHRNVKEPAPGYSVMRCEAGFQTWAFRLQDWAIKVLKLQSFWIFRFQNFLVLIIQMYGFCLLCIQAYLMLLTSR